MTTSWIQRTPFAMKCVHCESQIELQPFTLRCPEAMCIARQVFTLEHQGCAQYGDDHEGARSHRRFVKAMRRQMRKSAA